MKIKNVYSEEQVIVPTATSLEEAVRIFDFYYAKLGYFQVQVTQFDHMFFESTLYKLYFDRVELAEGEKRGKKVRHRFFCLENMVRLKKYGEIYLDMQLKVNANDDKKTPEIKAIFERTFKRYKTRLSKAFNQKIEYLNNLALLEELDKVEHRNLIKPAEAVRMLEQFKLADPERFLQVKTQVDEEFAVLLKTEQRGVNKALKEHNKTKAKKAAQPKPDADVNP